MPIKQLLNFLIISAVSGFIFSYPTAEGRDDQREGLGRMLLVGGDGRAGIFNGYRLHLVGLFDNSRIGALLARWAAAMQELAVC